MKRPTDGHWEISRRLLEKEVFWPWSRSPGAPGAGFWRKRRSPSRSSSRQHPLHLPPVSEQPKNGRLHLGVWSWLHPIENLQVNTWPKKVLLPRTDNFITLFMSCQNISYFASQDCRQPQIKEDCPSGLTIVFPGKNDEHSKAEDSGNYISVSHSPETCNLFLSFASFFFIFLHKPVVPLNLNIKSEIQIQDWPKIEAKRTGCHIGLLRIKWLGVSLDKNV